MVIDADQADDLGLPLTTGPFATLDEAREAMASIRSGPPRTPARPSPPERREPRERGAPGDGRGSAKRPGTPSRSAGRRPRPATPPVVIRDLRVADGPELRTLWAACGFRSLGDDDLSLARLAKRNPGLVLVAVEGRRIVGSALGAWDGRRGWIYHVATTESHRRQGVATRLVRQVEDGLRALGCPKVNVIVRDGNDDGRRFWLEVGYEEAPARQLGRELAGD
jgi:ribosomal protein S18 acetylase RimI-like enzyme